MELPTESEPVRIVEGDCLDVLRALPDASVDAVVADPPAGIGFMGKEWDDFRRSRNPADAGRDSVFGRASRTGPEYGRRDRRAFVDFLAGVLAEGLRVTKPGGRLLCWSIPRTSHWTGTAVEDAGWEIENVVAHLFGSGFPKGKSQLKPAREDWWLARKPAPQVAPLNIDAARVPLGDDFDPAHVQRQQSGRQTWGDGNSGFKADHEQPTYNPTGRWPANVCHDGSPEVLAAFAEFGEKGGGYGVRGGRESVENYRMHHETGQTVGHGDTGTAARFFYCAKASRSERGEGNTHPTVKPVALMRWLVRLVTHPGDLVLDPFAGSGTTALACLAEGRRCLMVEREPAYCEIARRRVAEAQGQSVGSLFSGVPCEA